MDAHSNHSLFCSQNILSCILLYCIFIAPSCKEKKNDLPSADEKTLAEKQIYKINYGTDPDAEKWYEYNEKGDLIRQGMSADTIVYEYTDNRIVKRHLDKKHSWQSRIDFSTDQNGRITRSLSYDENDKEISKNEFVYDTVGYLIKNIEIVLASGSKYTNEYKYEAGNLKEVMAYDMYGRHTSSYVFEYYTDKPNMLNLFMQQISDDIFPNNRLGKRNKNLVKQMTNISKEGDTLALLKYNYAEENNDLILKEFQSDVLNEFDTELTYRFINKNK